MMDRLKRITLCVWALVLVGLPITGCGKKGPPVAPHSLPLTQVNDLQGALIQDTVRLTWRHVPENADAVGYIVLRAQSAVDQPQCPKCPLVFQKVGTVPVHRPQRNKPHEMAFVQEVAEGFRYTYSVRSYASSGAQGPDSNLVVITCLKDIPATPENGAPP
jgi:hypothetical protein